MQLSNLFGACVGTVSVTAVVGCDPCFMEVPDDQTSNPNKLHSSKKTTKTSKSVLKGESSCITHSPSRNINKKSPGFYAKIMGKT